jgi:hypothetical protein
MAAAMTTAVSASEKIAGSEDHAAKLVQIAILLA